MTNHPARRAHLGMAVILTLLYAAASQAQAATDTPAPCKLDAPTTHLGPGDRWHEYKNGYKTRNQVDLRSYEEAQLLEDSIVCMDQRLASLAGAINSNNTLLEHRRTELTNLLTAVSNTLSSLNQQIKNLQAIKVDVHTHADSAPDSILSKQIANTLTAQNAVLQKIQTTLETAGATPEINVTATSSLSSTNRDPRADTHPRDQIDPTQSVHTYYDAGTTRFEFAIATIPDPRVPRHRRQYDNAIAAISQGMLVDGFVLDKFAFPWAKDLLPASASKATDDPTPDLKVVDDDRYGLMIFRHDQWREPPPAARDSNTSIPHAVEIRALYLVAETGTYGVQPAALISAVGAINKDWPVPPTPSPSPPSDNSRSNH